MFIRLTFTTAKTEAQIYRILAQVINTPTITSISALSDAATTGTWAADLLQYLDTSVSYIYRTDDPVNTRAFISRGAVASGNFAFNFMIEQPIYDSPSTKYYTNVYNTGTTATTSTYTSGPSVTGGTMDSTQWAVTTSTTQTTAQGTILSAGAVATTAVASGANLFTAYIYITDNCFFFNADTVGYTKAAWSSSVGTSNSIFFSQYTRYDYWNTMANGIYPVAYTQKNFLISAGDIISPQNPNSATATESSFKVHSIVSNIPGTGTTWTIANNVRGCLGVGTRFSDVYSLTTSADGGASNTTLFGRMVYNSTYLQARQPTADLTARGYAMLPITWRNMVYNSMGGNITDISKVYLYNGDYCSGDEFIFNGTTYIIIPAILAGGVTTYRVGLAFPKE